MLKLIRQRGGATERQLRLFAVACCRQLLQQVSMGLNDMQAVEVAERYADGKVAIDELIAARYAPHLPPTPRTAAIACRNATETEDLILMADCAAGNAAWAAGEHAASIVNASTDSFIFIAAHTIEKAIQASILRDILGPVPFRTIHSVSNLLVMPAASKLIHLASWLYELRAFTFERMNLLADALQEVGWENDEIMSHCRNREQTHVRGCWVVDLILSKCSQR
jgi:hypothetical protein